LATVELNGVALARTGAAAFTVATVAAIPPVRLPARDVLRCPNDLGGAREPDGSHADRARPAGWPHRSPLTRPSAADGGAGAR